MGIKPKAEGSVDPSSSSFHSSFDSLRRLVIGKPRDLSDPSIHHRLSLIPLLAWVGLGADGLSSSSYGPEEAFRTLGEHTYLAVGLAILMAATVLIISAAYSRIIDEFPHGGGGYVVATKTLGEKAGVISGCALLVDYVLTITVSIAASGDALFSLLPMVWHEWKLPIEMFLIVGLTTLNIRGVKESVMVLAPIFLLFLLTHALLITGGIGLRLTDLPQTLGELGSGFKTGYSTLGLGGMLLLFAHAFSLGGGTYTGIEAVSNGLPIMREPRVKTGKRTMVYMATSLAFTASGLLLCYLLWDVTHVEGKTLNAVLTQMVAEGGSFGTRFITATLLSEGAILIVAAQAGFLDGPRVLANMAVDSWFPRHFASLSERLTTMNGILLMGGASFIALYWTGGEVHSLVVMYSINVFLTFSLSTFGMAQNIFRTRSERPVWRGRFTIFVVAFLLCAIILVITSMEKFNEGGWITLVITGALVTLCFLIRGHYRTVGIKLGKLYKELEGITFTSSKPARKLNPDLPTAVILVGGYSGLGIHTVLNAFKAFPHHFQNLVFISVGVIDSGEFKGEGAVESLIKRTQGALEKYLELAKGLGVPAAYEYGVGTDAVDEAVKLCLKVTEQYPRATFFAGKLIFQREKWYQRLLHNETAFILLKRLGEAGKTMVVLPAVVR